jgi:hypothetical protein
MSKGFTTLIIAVIAIEGIALGAKSLNEWKLELEYKDSLVLECVTQKADELNKIYEGISLSIKFEVRHFLQMRMNILRWCPIPKSFAWARI